jgi:hypothetical protein
MFTGIARESQLIGGPSKFMLAQQHNPLGEKHAAFAEFIA